LLTAGQRFLSLAGIPIEISSLQTVKIRKFVYWAERIACRAGLVKFKQ